MKKRQIIRTEGIDNVIKDVKKKVTKSDFLVLPGCGGWFVDLD